ncbi:MAG: tetratricopeptide repeat protein [Bacteroidota bacterium]
MKNIALFVTTLLLSLNLSAQNMSQQQPIRVLLNVQNIGAENPYSEKIKDLFIFSFIDQPSFVIEEDTARFRLNLKNTSYDYLVRGINHFNEKEFILDFQVITAQDSITRVPNIICSPGDMYQAVNTMAHRVSEQIRQIETAKGSAKKIVIVPANSALKFQRYLLDIDQKPANRIKVVSWDNANRYYGKMSNGFSPAEIFNKTGADAIMRVAFEQSEFIRVEPQFIIRTPPQIITLPPIILQSYKPEVLAYVQQDFNQFFEFIVDPTGAWSMNNINTVRHVMTIPLPAAATEIKNLVDRQEWVPANLLAYRAIGEKTTDPEVYLLMAYMLLKLNQREQADHFIEIALKNNPNDYRLLYMRGLTYITVGKYYDALNALKAVKDQQAHYSFMDLGDLDLQIGKAQYATNNVADAIATLLRYLSERPDDIEAHYYLGKSYLIQENIKSSEAEFSAVYAKDPNYKDVQTSLAKSLYLLGSGEYAASRYADAYNYLKRVPESAWDTESAMLYVRTCYQLKKFSEAETVVKRFVSTQLFDPLTIYRELGSNLKLIFDKNRDQVVYAEKAREYLMKHLEISPKDSEGLWSLGNTLVNLRDFKGGWEYLRRAHNADTTAVLCRLDYAEASILVGDYERIPSILTPQVIGTVKSLSDKSIYLLALYLRSVAFYCIRDYPSKANAKVLSRDPSSLKAELDRKRNIYGWSYQAFEFWLEHKNFNNPENKSAILELTVRMKQLTVNI